jgi:hypothetical protein
VRGLLVLGCITGVKCAGRFDEKDLAFPLGGSDVFHASRNDVQLTSTDYDVAVPVANRELSPVHEEYFIRIVVLVPDELTLNLHCLNMEIIHLRDDLRRPMICKPAKLVIQIRRFASGQVSTNTSDASTAAALISQYRVGFVTRIAEGGGRVGVCSPSPTPVISSHPRSSGTRSGSISGSP